MDYHAQYIYPCFPLGLELQPALEVQVALIFNKKTD